MKRQYLFAVVAISLSFMMNSCGGSDSIDENTAPTVPSQVFPLNNTICIENNVVFQWSKSTDAEGNLISYHIEISEDNTFETLSKNEVSFSESKIISLEKGKAYYWRIKATDDKSADSNYSPVMQFVTEGEGTINHVPFAPTLISPSKDTEVEGASTTLSWSSSDVDGDSLTYDVYLDTKTDPVTKVSENQTATTFEATGLEASTKYYFKVVVKDGNGASSIGQVWSFTTK